MITTKKINELQFKKKPRSLSRLVALQILFQNNYSPRISFLEKFIDDFIKNYFINEELNSFDLTNLVDKKFILELITGHQQNQENYDVEISALLKNSLQLKNIDNLELDLIRLACFEFTNFPQTPKKVIISEYVDIAGCFFTDKKINFINGILVALEEKFRKA